MEVTKKKKMRIGIVCYPTFGGSGVVATELGKALAAEGNEIHFITYHQPVRLNDEIPANIYYHEVSVSQYPLFDYTPYELVLTSKLVNVVKYEKLDLLHVHYAIPHASAAYMAKKILQGQGINIPFITTLHGTDITLVGKDASFEPVITFAINKSDAVTAVSSSLKKDTIDHFDIKTNIEVIPNFICTQHYSTVVDKELRSLYAKEDERILIHVSNFRKVKRVQDVVKVFQQVKRELPSKLILIGDGPERDHVQQICRQYDICGDIKFLGKVKYVEKILSLADLFVLTSQTESFGLAALEAMASRVPVVSTNTGGTPEVNEHGVSGLLSDVGDIDQMAKNAISIIKDESTLNRYKENALKRAFTFDIQKILPQYVRLYQTVLERNEKVLT